jgi:hypothetical protein
MYPACHCPRPLIWAQSLFLLIWSILDQIKLDSSLLISFGIHSGTTSIEAENTIFGIASDFTSLFNYPRFFLIIPIYLASFFHSTQSGCMGKSSEEQKSQLMLGFSQFKKSLPTQLFVLSVSRFSLY